MSIFEYDKEEEERKLWKAEYEAGIKEGELQKAKETVVMMNKMKFPVEKIAQALQVDEDVIVEWIKTNKWYVLCAGQESNLTSFVPVKKLYN